MQLTYPACFYPDEEQKGAYAVVVPDLPGCVSGGNTLAEAILMGTDAASGWVLDELEDGKPAPEASPIGKHYPGRRRLRKTNPTVPPKISNTTIRGYPNVQI